MTKDPHDTRKERIEDDMLKGCEAGTRLEELEVMREHRESMERLTAHKPTKLND